MDKKKLIILMALLAAVLAFFVFDLSKFFSLSSLKVASPNLRVSMRQTLQLSFLHSRQFILPSQRYRCPERRF